MDKVRFILFLLLFLVASCSDEVRPDNRGYDQVEVSLDIIVDGPGILTDEVSVKSPVEETEIKDLWIIQYVVQDNEDSNDDAVLLGYPTYIDNFQKFYADENNRKIKLLATEKRSLIVFIANTLKGEEEFVISQGSDFGELKQRKLNTFDNLFGHDASEDKSYIILNDCYISGDTGISNGANIEVHLRRNIAKVNISVLNESEVTLTSLQICSVPDKTYYVTDYDGLSSPFPALDDLVMIDYPFVEWPEGNLATMSAYLPVNLRGTSAYSISELSKNHYAPEGATYLLVSGTYKDGQTDVPINYRFYLGENMVDNYNILPNSHYEFSFVITQKGDSETDSRVEDMGLVDFTGTRYEPANSYILNPGTVSRRFRIPIDRIFTFWGNDKYAYYEDDTHLSLRTGNGKWHAFITQSDFEVDGAVTLTVDSGNAPANRYFEVEVQPDVEGNVVVAVGPDDGSGKISWSWHLWITDYDPYVSLYWEDSVDKKYIYEVKNGSVHRYEGSFWENNRSHYIMDRNLGWTSDPHVYPADNNGLLYYQFGRKDPMFFSNDVPVKEYAVANAENGVSYSIMNPEYFIKSPGQQDWTIGNKYNPTQFEKNIIWNDPTTVPGALNEGEKSIFDPCPPGFRLPECEIWYDCRYNKDARPTTNTFEDKDYAKGETIEETDYRSGFVKYNTIKGMQYWPFQGEGVLIPDKDIVVYIPATGFIDPSGKLRSDGNGFTDGTVDTTGEYWSFLWSEKPYDAVKGLGYTSQQDHLAVDNETPRSRALPVRCITDK